MKRSVCLILALCVVFGSVYAAPKSKIKIAMIVESTVDDKGWCQSMHDAIMAVQKKYGSSLVEYSGHRVKSAPGMCSPICPRARRPATSMVLSPVL